MRKLFTSYFLSWTLILFFGLFLRIYGLNLNPIGLSHDDELHEILNAKSIAVTGSHKPDTVAGIFSPNYGCPGNCVYGELGSYILIPWMQIFPLDLFWSKIPFVLVSVGLIFLVGKLFENLSHNRTVGLLVALSVAINPWAIHFGRTAYLTILSYFFYLLGAYLFTKYKGDLKVNLILGTIFSILGSMFYFGTKPILPLIIIWGIIYNLVVLKFNNIKLIIIILISTSFLMGIYFFTLSNSYAGRRISEINSRDPHFVKKEVDYQRRNMLEMPYFLRDITVNKYTVEIEKRVDKIFGFFSPQFLFLEATGDTDIYYDSNHGYYYPVDSLFLIFGIMALAINLRVGIFILLLVIISISPAAIKTTGDTIYSQRAALAYPIVSGIIGWGIYFLYQYTVSLKRTTFSRFFILLMFFIYIFSVGNFLIRYWFQNPIEKNIGWYFHKRVLSSYLTRLDQLSEKEAIVVTSQPFDTFNTFIFYGNLYEKRGDILRVNKIIQSENLQYQKVKFINNCKEITDKDLIEKVVIIEQTVACDIKQNNSAIIANPRDGGGMYDIINESICLNYQMNRYPYPRSIHDFEVERLSQKGFCEKWITNPDLPF